MVLPMGRVSSSDTQWIRQEDAGGRSRMAGNASLGAAKAKKNDEFYTQWRDIEAEMVSYLDYDPDVFRDKVVLLPCDDPARSNFTKYFSLHFEKYGIKKLISTGYAPASNLAIAPSGQFSLLFDPDERGDSRFSEDKHWNRGRIYTLERGADESGDGKVDIDDLRWDYLEGDGDFRSKEVTALRDEADIVVSNPPFSLFREFISWLMVGKVQFSIVGNNNAITYKEVFPLIKNNLLWKGATANSTDMVFEVPKGAEVKQSDMDKAARLGFPSDENHKYTRLGNSAWFTNIQHGRRHEFIELLTMAENQIFGPNAVRQSGYPVYDNFDAIEVPATKAIPSDYAWVMGVPISFLDRYNPEQFEIVGTTEGDYPATRKYSKKRRVVDGVPATSNTGTMSGVIREDEFGKGTYFDVGYPVRAIYKRILIRHKNSATTEGE